MSGPRPCCLVAEDQALVGLSLEAYLEDAGFDVAGPFTANAEAVRWLAQSHAEFAIVDVVLRDGPCLKLAKQLKHLGVPFAIYSGLPRAEQLPPELQDVPWLEKPASREMLVRVLSAMTSANKIPAE